MDGIIEPVDISPMSEILSKAFQKTVKNEPLSFIECGAKSWVLDSDPLYYQYWKPILDLHKQVATEFCPLATGFNFSKSVFETVPPHVDLDKGRYFNLLLPIHGVARIDIYETNPEDLEYRHGKSHWKMLKPDRSAKKIGEYALDRPTLLDTNQLHAVTPVDVPRLVWCTRWISLKKETTFKDFKSKIEKVLNG